jgi:hypothetical protein
MKERTTANGIRGWSSGTITSGKSRNTQEDII